LLFHSFLQSYGEEVKAKKRKTADACALGAEVEGKYTLENDLLVVGRALQGSDEPKIKTSKVHSYKR